MDNAIFNAEKMYTFAKGFAMGRGMTDTVNALSYARRKHKNQTRKSGEPYITHPLTMACDAISMGITDDVIVAAIMLHDVVEDCGATLDDLPVSEETKEVINLVTKDFKGSNPADEQRYYKAIAKNEKASIVKLIDRCHNISTMAGTFTSEKLDHYISETETYILPLLRTVKDNHPTYSNILFTMKYHIISVLNAIEGTRGMYEAETKLTKDKDTEVPTIGYWRNRGDKKDFLWCECSNCGFMIENYVAVIMGTSDIDYIGVKYNFCPKCGAKMEAKAETDRRANRGH